MEIIVSSTALWILFVILIGVLIFNGVIFNYHWNHYGINETNRKVAKVIYYFVSAVLLTIIIFFIGFSEINNVI
jgi:hypothetical protein